MYGWAGTGAARARHRLRCRESDDGTRPSGDGARSELNLMEMCRGGRRRNRLHYVTLEVQGGIWILMALLVVVMSSAV